MRRLPVQVSVFLLVLLWVIGEKAVGTEPLPGRRLARLIAGTATQGAPQDSPSVVTRRVWAGARARYLVSPSPDGRFLSLTDWPTGDLAVRNIETGETRRLTNNQSPLKPGYTTWSVVSPDGGMIAYDWWNAERQEAWELHVVNWDGSEPRVVHDDEGTSYVRPHDWSPDGRFVLTVMTRAGLPAVLLVLVEVASAVTTELEQLSSYPGKASFSPDGRFIAYDAAVGNAQSQRDIFVRAVDGSSKTRIASDSSNDYLLGWAPDGNHILLSSRRTGTPGIWLQPVREGRSAGEAQLVLPDMWGVVPVGFARDGTYFYGVQTGSVNVYIATLGRESASVVSPPTLAVQPGLGSTGYPAWSPDGRHLAFLQSSPEGQGLTIRSLETGQVREIRLVPGLRPVATPRWMPDGRSLALVAGDAMGPTGIYRVYVQTGASEVLVEEQLPPWPGDGFDLSPDGHHLYYRGGEGAGDELSIQVVKQDIVNGETEVIQSLAFREGHYRNLAVSPDGSALALSSLRDLGGRYEHWLEVLPTAGGHAKRLATLPFISSVAWAADGRTVLYAGDGGRLWRIDAAGGEPERVGVELDGMSHLRVHPDGRRIAFTAGRTARELWVMKGLLPESR